MKRIVVYKSEKLGLTNEIFQINENLFERVQTFPSGATFISRYNKEEYIKFIEGIEKFNSLGRKAKREKN